MSDKTSGRLTFQISADIAALKQAMQEAQAGFKTLGDRVNQVADQTRSASLIMAQSIGTALGSGIVSLAGQLKAAFDEAVLKMATLQRQSDDTRLSVEKLARIRLEGIAAGLDVSEINAALKVFTAETKKTESDAKDLYKALNNIGPGLGAAFKNAPTQAGALDVVRGALAKTKDEVKQAQLAIAAFGSDSPRLIAAFQGAERAIGGAAGMVDKLGLAMDGNLAKAAEEARRKSAAFSEVIQNQVSVALANILPIVNELAARLPAMFNMISVGLANVTGNFNLLTNDALKQKIEETKGQVTEFQRLVQDDLYNGDEAKLRKSAPRLAEYEDTLKELEGILKKRQELEEKFKTPTLPDGGKRFTPRQSLNGDEQATEEKRKQIDRYINSLEIQAHREEELTRTFNASNLEKAKAINLAKLKDLADQNGIKLTEEMKRKVESLTAVEVKAQETRERLQAINATAMQVGDSLTNAFEGVIIRGQRLNDVLADLLRSLASMSLRAALLGDGPLGTALGLGGRNGGPGGLFGSLFSSLGGFFGGFRAEGGPVSAGVRYTVGERGPETFVPSVPGAIVPAGGGGGPTVVQHTVHMHVSLDGANGDAAIRRIAYDAARQGMEGVRREFAGMFQENVTRGRIR